MSRIGSNWITQQTHKQDPIIQTNASLLSCQFTNIRPIRESMEFNLAISPFPKIVTLGENNHEFGKKRKAMDLDLSLSLASNDDIYDRSKKTSTWHTNNFKFLKEKDRTSCGNTEQSKTCLDLTL